MSLTLRDQLGLRYPIIQAPMGGGPTTPELVAAVSNAGGLGSLAGGYLSADAIREAAQKTRTLTDHPFVINLFAETHPTPPDEIQIAAWIERLKPYHAQLGLPSPTLPIKVAESFDEQFEAVLEVKPAVFSFTFGIPAAHYLESLRERNILIMGTATTVDEGQALEAAGVDAVIAQGSEAGAHRGTFLHRFEDALVPTLDLVRQLRAAVQIPIIASGGLMDGRDISGALLQGAELVQLGTCFLTCPEAGTSAPYRKALLKAATDNTELITAYSGRPARGLPNQFVEETKPFAPLPYPYQNTLTRTFRSAAAQQGNEKFLSLWAGQGVTRTRTMPAAELIETLGAEIEQALSS